MLGGRGNLHLIRRNQAIERGDRIGNGDTAGRQKKENEATTTGKEREAAGMENEELSQTGPDVQHKNSVLAVAVPSLLSKGQARPNSPLFLKTNWLCRELKIYN